MFSMWKETKVRRLKKTIRMSGVRLKDFLQTTN